jgi:hypothetical protein
MLCGNHVPFCCCCAALLPCGGVDNVELLFPIQPRVFYPLGSLHGRDGRHLPAFVCSTGGKRNVMIGL